MIKSVTMYRDAKVYINGKYQVSVNISPSRGIEEAARTVLGLTPSGGKIRVKQGRYTLGTWRVLRKPGHEVILEPIQTHVRRSR